MHRMWWNRLMRVTKLLGFIPLMLVEMWEMDLRLNGAGCRCSGWLEVLHAATWKRIDSRNFTQQNAELACRQLGCHLPFGILQPYVEELEKHETCLVTCQGNETALKDCIACDSHDFFSLGVFLVCQQAPVQTTMVLQPTTAPVVTSSKPFGRKIQTFADGDNHPRTNIEEGTSLCSGIWEPDVKGYEKMLCLSLLRWWDKLVPRTCQGVNCEKPGHKDKNREKSLHHWEKLQCEKRNLSIGNCSASTQECLHLTLVRCSDQDLKSQKSSSETVLGILLGLVLIAGLLSICALPTYKKVMKKYSKKRQQQWIGPSGVNQNVSFHRKSSTAFQSHIENPVVQEERNKASKTYLSPYAAMERATNRSSSPLDNSSDSDYDLCSAQKL
ncbi:T-cell surface glycoprotein CD5 isoform X2 [Thamnophis elegans]|uniref:T-cell surface glycoprotein CD5 isoform X2 n=1 Tax=Thamnophis elegans TaxID=35005 RepID=UPI0013788552|nr:T-cell surface glycoprotein CD5 isoform X2 [Thamnophis elegans]